MGRRRRERGIALLVSAIAAVATGLNIAICVWTCKRRSRGQRTVVSAGRLAQRNFRLEPALLQGKLEVGSLQLCKVLLVDDSQYAGWLVLVPQQNNLTEVIDLSADAQRVLWEEVAAAMRVVRRVFKPDKLNQAAIGNVVSQLHIHVAGRRRGDPAWPGVHLGARPAEPFRSIDLEEAMADVTAAFADEAAVALLPPEVGNGSM